MATAKPITIDEYIAGFPKETQQALEKIRSTIKKAAPGAEEMISYAIPAFKHNGTYLVYFAGYKKHVSLYPVPKGDNAFNEAIASYLSGKSTAQFPLDKPLPASLLAKFVRFSVQSNAARAKTKKKQV
jgi:uncharacterized protein YdhG (YjbR/CyaY superfamily)